MEADIPIDSLINLRRPKVFRDSIHKTIYVSQLACRIIDTIEFYRLRDIHQTGVCYLVYQNANHNRFEHSIGTYHLAGVMLESIRKNSDKRELQKGLIKIPELKETFERDGEVSLSDHVIELIKIAGLCHDLGHGPFSHLFDDEFLTHENDDPLEEHENRSCEILKMIARRDKLPITESELTFISDIINPGKNHVGFVYQIVSNSVNGVDIDKFDYIVRDTHYTGLPLEFDGERLLKEAKVINDRVCFPAQISENVSDMFRNRYHMHRKVYGHKVVIGIQHMIIDMMNLLETHLHMRDSIKDMNKFIKLTDTYVMSFFDYHEHLIETSPELKEAFNIYNRIKGRKLYKHIGTIIFECKAYEDESLTRAQMQSITPGILSLEVNNALKPEEIIVHRRKIGYVSGSKSYPLDKINFYDDKRKGPGYFIMERGEATTIQPSTYQEYVVLVYSRNRDPEKVKVLREAFSKMKGQVKEKLHATNIEIQLPNLPLLNICEETPIIV